MPFDDQDQADSPSSWHMGKNMEWRCAPTDGALLTYATWRRNELGEVLVLEDFTGRVFQRDALMVRKVLLAEESYPRVNVSRSANRAIWSLM